MKFKLDDKVLFDPDIKNVKPIPARVTGAALRYGVEAYTVQPLGRTRTWRAAVEQLKPMPKPKRVPAKAREVLTLESAAQQITQAVADAGGTVVSAGGAFAESSS